MNFIETEILAKVFSCEFCEILKNTFFTKHRQTTASVCSYFSKINLENTDDLEINVQNNFLNIRWSRLVRKGALSLFLRSLSNLS